MGDHAQGRVEQSNFDDYQVVRIDEAPTATCPHIVEQGLEVPSSSCRRAPVCRRSAISWRDAGLSLRQSSGVQNDPNPVASGSCVGPAAFFSNGLHRHLGMSTQGKKGCFQSFLAPVFASNLSYRERQSRALYQVQKGLDPSNWELKPTIDAGVCEIRIRDAVGAYRVIYIVDISRCDSPARISKKSQKTVQRDVDLGRPTARLKQG